MLAGGDGVLTVVTVSATGVRCWRGDATPPASVRARSPRSTELRSPVFEAGRDSAMEDLSGVKDAIRDLAEKVNAIEASVVVLNDRLKPNAERRHVASSSQPAIAAEAQFTGAGEHQEPVRFDSAADLQSQFRAIRDSLSKVKLPQDLVVGDSRSGIGKTDLARFQVIQKCAQFQETALKILSGGSTADPVIDQLSVVALAQIRYLQEEYTNLIVSNQFDESTAQLFKTLQHNSSAFTPSAVENLQRAVTIAGARQHTRQVSQAPDRARWRGPPPPLATQRFGPASADWRSRGRPGPGYPALSRDLPRPSQQRGAGAQDAE